MPSDLKLNPELLELMQEDPAFCQEITMLFEADGYKLLAELKQALGDNDAEAIEKSAHALKGIFSNTGFLTLREQLAPIMTWNREGQLTRYHAEAEGLYQELFTSFKMAVEYIQQLATELSH